jgi:signal transduction histidine kinase
MGVKLLQDNRVGELNTEQKNIVTTLFDEMGRISRITNELLDLSQVETGNIKLNIKKAHPKDIIPTAIEAVKFQAERKNVTVQVKIDSAIPEVLADFDKTAWVLVNYLTNAIRYSPENGSIIVKGLVVDKQVEFSVKDEGPGIEKKYMSRLFEKFYQVPGTPSGTGLGLAISKEFIEAQQGSVSVTSEIGKGSSFSFTLPVAP